MPQAFAHLFAPLVLRHKTLKHRLNMGAHTTNMAEDGLPAARHLGYCTERARWPRAAWRSTASATASPRAHNSIFEGRRLGLKI